MALLAGAALTGGYLVWSRSSADAPPSVPPAAGSGRPAVSPAPGSSAPAEKLDFRELLEPGAALKPSAKTLALAGKRARMVGFMAQMELPPSGAFYLVPRPVHCDEAGGGTADLPPENVLVISRSAAGRAISFIDGALEVTGVLEVGNRADADGRVSAIRLLLDGPLREETSRAARAETN